MIEFRGTTLNLDGAGRAESGRRAVGPQFAGTTREGRRYFGVEGLDGAEFWMTYPRDQSLGSVKSRHLETLLVRRAGRRLTASPVVVPDVAHWSNAVELEGAVKITLRDEAHFKINLDVKARGTNGPALKGQFIAYHKIKFEPMAYVAGAAMTFGFSESSFGPSPPPHQEEGDLALVRRSLLKLAGQSDLNASFRLLIIDSNSWLDFSRDGVWIDPPTIRLELMAGPSARALIKPGMESACRELGLTLVDHASVPLAHPTVETEPHFLSVKVHGQAGEVADRLVIVLRRAFGVSDATRFGVTE